MRNLRFLTAVILTLLTASCASMYTSQSQYVEAEAFVRQGDYRAAAMVIEESKGISYQEKERVLYFLDLGMLYHYAEMYEESNAMLTEAEYAIEELYTQSISKAIGSGILNDNALDYDGEVYEDLYINIFKGLNYAALGDSESALVEIRRVNNKLNLLQDKYDVMYDQYIDSGESRQAVVSEITNEFHNNALARYLGCILYRNMGDYDDARIDRDLLNESYRSQPGLYPFAGAAAPVAAAPGDGSIPVNFFAFTGQAPNKVSSTYYIDSAEDVLYFTAVEQNSYDYLRELTGLTSMYVPGLPGGFHMKMEFPRMDGRARPVDQVLVFTDNLITADLMLTEDIEHIAQATFAKELPLIIGKTITRALVKGLLKEAADQAIEEELEGSGLGLLKALLDTATEVAVDATENADLRVSNFFPAKAFTSEIFLTPGVYDLRIEYYYNGNLLFTDHKGQKEINKNNSIIESFFLF